MYTTHIDFQSLHTLKTGISITTGSQGLCVHGGNLDTIFARFQARRCGSRGSRTIAN